MENPDMIYRVEYYIKYKEIWHHQVAIEHTMDGLIAALKHIDSNESLTFSRVDKIAPVRRYL